MRRTSKCILYTMVGLSAVLAGGATRLVEDQCGPFTDVTPAFCPYVLELYYLAITVGTSATTFSPDDPLTRGQGAVFIAKGLNQSLARSSRRAALGQWWTPQNYQVLGTTTLPSSPITGISCDGADVWVSNLDLITRVRASDGRILESWSAPGESGTPLVAMGRLFVVSSTGPMITGIFMIDPTQPAGAVVSVVSFPAGDSAEDIVFDGGRIWCPLTTPSGDEVAIVTPGPTLPWSYTTVSGFGLLLGMIFDGKNIWVADANGPSLLKLDSNGGILQTVATGAGPRPTVFDGTNVWVTNQGDNSVTVVRAGDGSIAATLTGNGLFGPGAAAFDGQRVLVLNNKDCASLWKAADLSPLGCISISQPNVGATAVASDGINFWLGVQSNILARF